MSTRCELSDVHVSFLVPAACELGSRWVVNRGRWRSVRQGIVNAGTWKGLLGTFFVGDAWRAKDVDRPRFSFLPLVPAAFAREQWVSRKRSLAKKSETQCRVCCCRDRSVEKLFVGDAEMAKYANWPKCLFFSVEPVACASRYQLSRE